MSIFDRLRRAYARAQFHPGPLGILVNPFYFARQGILAELSRLAPRVGGEILDVGCGSKPYRELFASATRYVGMDVEVSGHDHRSEDIDVFYDGVTFPFGDGSFDSVLCFQVLEHVFEPARLLDEIRRVLRPGGQLLLTVPFVWDEHEQPYDYARYSSFGLHHLLGVHGLAVEESVKTCADSRALAQLVNAYVHKVAGAQPGPLRLAGATLISASVNVVGLAAQYVLPSNPDLYLDNIILARRRP